MKANKTTVGTLSMTATIAAVATASLELQSESAQCQ